MNRKLHTLLYLSSLLPLTACSWISPTTQDASREERIQQVESGLVQMSADGQVQWGNTSSLAERMTYYQVPGITIAVIENYQVEWVKGYGVQNAEGGEPITPETLFHAGSVGKSLSAAAAMTLVDKGLLDLDQDVNRTLISWQIPENQYTLKEKVTLRRLLSHSGGLEDGLTNLGPGDPPPSYTTTGDTIPTATLQQLLDASPPFENFRPSRVTALPGSVYRYSNADYAILQLLLEDVTGQAFQDFVRESVLTPLGMTSNSFAIPLPVELSLRTASEHYINGQPIEGGRMNFPFQAGGTLWTTPNDLAKFIIELMLAYQGRSQRLLTQTSAREMLTPQINIPNSPLSDAYGLGVELKSSSQGLVVWHSGGTWGSCSIIWFYPQIGKGAVVMINSASGNLLSFEILLSIATAYHWPME